MEKKTKIVCTIGPASWDKEVMRQMIEAGMNCARVNGAFADPLELDKVRELVRSISDDVSLMVDVKGPEIRLNKFENAKQIKPGDEIIIGNNDQSEIYPANYENVYTYLKPGQRMVIGDGDVELKLERIEGDKMYTSVVYGEVLKPGKALNLPGADYSSDVLTLKDQENLKHAIKTGWDFVSPSFINSKQSAQTIKDFIVQNGGDGKMKIIAKIEDQEGIDNIDEILEIVHGVMIARGGLGIELGLENVPHAQRVLTMKCNEAGKPVITATQMLDSMIENPRPTRAEASDVATAVLLGTDAVMLSAESSAGEYPVEAVKFLTSTVKVAEENLCPFIIDSRAMYQTTTDALTKAAAEVCIDPDEEIDTVIVVSRSGATARLLARHSIKQPIYLFTSSDYYKRVSLLTKNIVKAFVFEGISQHTDDYTRDNAVKIVMKRVKEEGLVSPGQKVLFIGNIPIDSQNFFPNLFEIIKVE
ncbi:pyruvate kinase [Candidatus Dojkabacteria bacterium]|uniref:Pyruvate kinase n=1 Tax=Candidatus Dojkabacteria bacterium TaxID=2099670 RepID=A0A955LA37_9BACT|nr:pyruvate kinase [Candidatus Dojkabacteria bacterium]